MGLQVSHWEGQAISEPDTIYAMILGEKKNQLLSKVFFSDERKFFISFGNQGFKF